jgi:adenosylmethionine-8-amino-7-oxononanoate aminotransferase
VLLLAASAASCCFCCFLLLLLLLAAAAAYHFLLLQLTTGTSLPALHLFHWHMSLHAASCCCSLPLAHLYRRYIDAAIATHESQTTSSSGSNARRLLGALLMEPVLQGAGGMLLVDPLFQAELVKVGRHCTRSL